MRSVYWENTNVDIAFVCAVCRYFVDATACMRVCVYSNIVTIVPFEVVGLNISNTALRTAVKMALCIVSRLHGMPYFVHIVQ